MKTKKFKKINNSFVCEICGYKNPPALKTCRNHCKKCLYSKHVDINPGDRAEKCQGKMKPINVELKNHEIANIIFECEKCGKRSRNKVAEDDNKFLLMELWNKNNL